MGFLLRGLPVIVEIALLVYCLIDCIQTDEYAVRNLPKTLWVILILFLPIIGPIAWLVAGRPERRTVPPATTGYPEYERPRRGAPVAPDDDPEFLAQLRAVNTEHESTLKQWEADLARREEELRRARGADHGGQDGPEGRRDGRREGDAEG